MDKNLVNLVDTCISVGVVCDHLRRLSEICDEEGDMLHQILEKEKLESLKLVIKSTDEILESNLRRWLEDNFNT